MLSKILTRRRMLAATSAGLAIGAVPIAAATTAADPLVALGAVWREAYRAEADAYAAFEAAGDRRYDGPDDPGSRWGRCEDRRNAVEAQIFETPATSAAGVSVKFAVAMARTDDRRRRYHLAGPDDPYLVSALADLERLVGKAVSS